MNHGLIMSIAIFIVSLNSGVFSNERMQSHHVLFSQQSITVPAAKSQAATNQNATDEKSQLKYRNLFSASPFGIPNLGYERIFVKKFSITTEGTFWKSGNEKTGYFELGVNLFLTRGRRKTTNQNSLLSSQNTIFPTACDSDFYFKL